MNSKINLSFEGVILEPTMISSGITLLGYISAKIRVSKTNPI